jgi:hypothetical protein
MRGGRDSLSRVESTLELPHDMAIKNVLNLIGVAINVRRRDVGVANQVQLPKSVVTEDASCAGSAGVGQPEGGKRASV